MNKYLEKVMITFQQFLEEAKKKKEKKEIEKIQSKTGKYSKNEVMKVLNSQGGIGRKAVQKYIKQNPNREPREYNLNDTRN